MRIAADGISVELGSKLIVDDVTVEAKSGTMVGIVGPNGCGKSTLLKCIYRTLTPQQGSVFFDGTNIREMSIKESARNRAVVAQHNAYAFDFTVKSLVLMGRSPHKRMMERDNADDFQIVNEALALVGMTDFAERIYSTLSGGERQRVILARAIAQRTACLVLDEPTNHLDVHHQLSLLTTVRRLGLTTIGAYHDLTLAARYCDFLYVMKNKRIVTSGCPRETLTPALIRDVFKVDAEVLYDSTENPVIAYRHLDV